MMMSSCFHTSPSSQYSDRLLGRMQTAKCCYQAGEEEEKEKKIKKHAEARREWRCIGCQQLGKITGIFCALFTVFDLWFPPVLGYTKRKNIGLCNCSRALGWAALSRLGHESRGHILFEFSLVLAFFSWFMDFTVFICGYMKLHIMRCHSCVSHRRGIILRLQLTYTTKCSNST